MIRLCYIERLSSHNLSEVHNIGLSAVILPPMAKCAQIRLIARFRFGMENVFNLLLKQLRNAESERQARIVFSDLNGVHSLPGYSQVRSEFSLRPIALRAQNSKTILHLLAKFS